MTYIVVIPSGKQIVFSSKAKADNFQKRVDSQSKSQQSAFGVMWSDPRLPKHKKQYK